MPEPDPIKANGSLVRRAEEVKDLVAGAHIDRAVQRVLDLTREFDPTSSNNAIVLSGRYKGLYQKQMVGTADTNDLSALAAIPMAILGLVDSIVKNASARQIVAVETRPIYGPIPGCRAPSTPETAIVLAARDLVKNRRKIAPQFELCVDKLNLLLGEITALIGPNGQGKTTLMEIVAGRLKCDAGTLRYPGLCGDTLDWPTAKARIAYVPHPAKPPHSAEATWGQSNTTSGGRPSRKEGRNG